MGRQPWVVFGLLKTSDANSPAVSTAEVADHPDRLHPALRRPRRDRRKDLLKTARKGPEPDGDEPADGGGGRARPRARLLRPMPDISFLQVLWFILISVLWLGYFVLEGFDFGVGMLIARGRPRRRRAPRRDPLDRSGLGRQRGLAAGRRRRDLRRLPGVVRDPLLGLLPRAVPDPRRADRPRRRVRVLGQARRPDLAHALGVGARSSAAPCPPCSGASAGRTSSTACRSAPTTSSPARCSTCSTPMRCSAAWRRSRSSSPTARLPRAARPRASAEQRVACDRRQRDARGRRDRAPCFVAWTLIDQTDRGGVEAVSASSRCSRWPPSSPQRSARRRTPIQAFAATSGGIVAALLRPVRRPLSERDGLEHRSGLQPELVDASSSHYTLTVMTVVAVAPRPGRPALPGLDLLGLPPPHRRRGLRRRADAARPDSSATRGEARR